MSGDDVVAVKRVVSRAGFYPWGQFTNTYGKDIEKAVAAFQKSVGIQGQGFGPPQGHYGKKTHDALREAKRASGGYPGEPAWDDYSTELYSQAIVPNTPPSFAFKRDLYGPPDKRYPMSGDDCLAVKRALSRAGFIPWQEFTNVYGQQAKDGCAAFQKAAGIKGDGGGPPQGHYGPKTHSALLKAKAKGKHEWAFDDYSAKLYKGYQAPGTGKGRQAALDHLAKRVGYTEQPANSNTDNRSDGIRTAQTKTAGGGTWLVGQPWCGCWCFYALDAAGVAGLNSSLASVASIEDAAKAKQAPFGRGWTTDRSKVKKGDLVVVGGYGVHVETVRGFDGSTTLTYGGNTSSGSSGSQSNGGGAYARSRYPSEVRGYALVRYPGE